MVLLVEPDFRHEKSGKFGSQAHRDLLRIEKEGEEKNL